MVNFEKSCINFSPNNSENVKRQTLASFGLKSGRAHDKYLGLPTIVGRNKRRVFGDIKDKVWKWISG